MKRIIIILGMALLGACMLMAASTAEAPMQTAETASMGEAQRAGYAIGHDLGTQALARVRADRVDVDPKMLLRGFQDAVNGAAPILDTYAMTETLAVIEREVTTRIAKARMDSDPVFRALAEENLRRSRKFHAEFGKNPDVVTLPGGAQYRVLTPGTGRMPTASDVVVVEFDAWVIDGARIGRTERELRLGAMLPGGRAIVERMKIGDRFHAAIPPDQAFGIGGQPPNIGPNETVIVDVTLVAIK